MLSLKALALLLLPTASLASITTLPNTLYNGSTTAEQVSSPGNLDMPKLSPGVNETSYDW